MSVVQGLYVVWIVSSFILLKVDVFLLVWIFDLFGVFLYAL